MKYLENRILDSKREMYILAALGEAKSMKVYFSRVRTNAWGSCIMIIRL